MIIGSVVAAEPLLPLAEKAQIAPGQSQTWEFDVSAELLARQPALSVLARLDTPTLAGSTFAMRVTLNGHLIDVSRLLNKPRDTEMLSGLMLSWYGQQAFRVVYSPDYEMANGDDKPACLVGGHAYDFVLEVGDLLKAGENTLVIAHTAPSITRPLTMTQMGLVPAPPRIAESGGLGTPPPTGPLPVVAPKTPGPVDYRLEVLPHGGFALQGGQERVVVRSSFSYPNVGWNTLGEKAQAGEEDAWKPVCQPRQDGSYEINAGGTSYRLRRRLTPRPDHVAVADRFTNLTDAPLHIGLRYAFPTDGLQSPQVYLAGKKARIMDARDRLGENPTVLLRTGDWGFGIVAEDDVLRVQCSQQIDPVTREAGLLDHFFMLPAGAQYEVRWSAYPVPGGDYYDLVNAIRRNWGANFTIYGPFAFAPHPTRLESTGLNLETWLANGKLDYVSLQIPNPRPAELSHGLAFLRKPEEQQRLRKQADLLRSLRPGMKVLQYLHVYITRLDEAVETHRDAAHLGPDRTQYSYAAGAWKPTFWLFLPTTSNAYGREMNKTFDLCLDELGFDGIYWDEMAYSAHDIGYGIRDGRSALPDLKTMTVKEQVALTPLYCQDYQVQQARRVLDAGKLLIGNGQPRTETMARLHFPRFVEAWHPSKLRRAHLYCPVGLGSPDRINSEDDIAANIRDNLEGGGLWYYYCNWGKTQLTRPTITAHMYPFTPIELHAGTLIGQERILTTRSGLFGWRDRSGHRAFVYDHRGFLQPDFQVPLRTIEGSTYTELRIPGGWLAAIERVP